MVSNGVFGWCIDGQHRKCRRAYRRRQLAADNKTWEWTDEIVICQCPVKSCNCNRTANNKPIEDLEPL